MISGRRAAGISTSLYFPFRRIKIAEQAVDLAATEAAIGVALTGAFSPYVVCAGRRLPACIAGFSARCGIRTWPTLRSGCEASTASCSAAVVNESVSRTWSGFTRILRVTRRLAAAAHQLCEVMTVADAARHFLQQNIIELESQNIEQRKGGRRQRRDVL